MNEEIEQFLGKEFQDYRQDLDLGFPSIEPNDDLELLAETSNCQRIDGQEIVAQPSNVDFIETDVFDVSEVVITSSSQRKRRGRPQLMISEAEKKERQKEINRKAAQKYRRKLKSEALQKSLDSLKRKNGNLKRTAKDLVKQINIFKSL